MSDSNSKKMKKNSKSDQKNRQDKKVRHDHIIKDVSAIGPPVSKMAGGISGALVKT
ncbi:MAG: hypothetical protein HQL99_16305 [Magnetococcales bacterium]|nr:hypothetical protein [Magnetococcales bacterium]